MLTTGGDVWSILQRLEPWSPMAAVPFAAAFALAWLTDLRPERWSVPKHGLRWLEGLGLAAVLAGTAGIAFIYVREFLEALPPDLRRGTPPAIHVIVLIQAGLGFLIGVLVPHLYRRARSEGAADEARRNDALSPRTALPQGAD
jgi:formate hydrogenlyase subunit 3/multisubunit Na+/H+ antiporter MnhD subunit